MPTSQRIALVLLAGLMTAAPGCAGRSPFGLFSRKETTKYPGPSTTIAAYERQPRSGSSLSRTAANEDKSFGEKVTGGFKQVGSKITGAFTMKPKVEQAGDPIKLSSEPDSIQPEVYLFAARARETRGDVDGAIEQFRKALDVSPNDRRALLGLARLYDRKGDFASAIPIYERAIKAYPDWPASYNSLGLCYARNGRLDKAIEMLQRAVALEPDKPIHRNNLSAVLVEAGRVDDALKELTVVHTEDVAHYNLGYLFYEKGEQDLAYRHLQRAVQMNPSLSPAQHLLDQLHGELRTARLPEAPPVNRTPAPRASVPANTSESPSFHFEQQPAWVEPAEPQFESSAAPMKPAAVSPESSAAPAQQQVAATAPPAVQPPSVEQSAERPNATAAFRVSDERQQTRLTPQVETAIPAGGELPLIRRPIDAGIWPSDEIEDSPAQTNQGSGGDFEPGN